MSTSRKLGRDGHYHTPVWPHVQATYGERMIAYLDVDATLYGEPLAGCPQTRLETWESLSDTLYAWDSLIWCYDLVSALLPHMSAILAETQDTRETRRERGQQWCEVFIADTDSGAAQPVLVTVHRLIRGRWRMRHFANGSAWGIGVPATREEIPGWLARLRWLFDTLGAGIHPTPGSTGQHAMHQGWRDHPEWGTHHRPPLHAVDRLHHFGIGGRCEVYQQRRTFDVAFEMDMHNAYCAFAGRVPDGSPIYIAASGYNPNTGENSLAWRQLWPPDAPPLDNATWFANCAVAIRADLEPGDILPLALRTPTPNDPHAITWPTQRGMYNCWLWREEAEAIYARQLDGDPVELCAIEEAFVWERWTDHLAPWAERLDGIREHSPGPMEQRMVKGCMVAAIGRLAMPYERMRLVPESDARAGDVDWSPQWAPDTGYVVRREFEDSGLPAAWPVYIWMRTNLAIYEAARAERQAGNRLIAAHVDALFFERRPRSGAARFNLPPAMGEFRVLVHHPFRATRAGMLLSPQKFRAAGVPKKRQAGLLRMGEHEKPLDRYNPHERTRREYRRHAHAINVARLESFERALGYG